MELVVFCAGFTLNLYAQDLGVECWSNDMDRFEMALEKSGGWPVFDSLVKRASTIKELEWLR